MALAGAIAAPPAGATDRRLTGSEIRNRLAGHTVRFPAGDERMVQAVLAGDGKMRGMLTGKDFIGQWSVRGDRLCTRLLGDADAGCNTVLLRDRKRLFLYTPAGEPAGELTILPGHH